MPTLVFTLKEAKTQNVTPSMPSLNKSSLKDLVKIEKDGTKLRLGQEESLVSTPKTQGEAQQEVSKDENPEELQVTIAQEEQISIQTLVTLPIFVTPPSN